MGVAPDDLQRVGRYTLLRRLGRGSMGVVYLASDPHGALVALKVISGELADDEAFRRRFVREVAAARRVARFCTAPVLDADVDGPVAYLVTDTSRDRTCGSRSRSMARSAGRIWRRWPSGSASR
jgi:hypothetical protein